VKLFSASLLFKLLMNQTDFKLIKKFCWLCRKVLICYRF